MNKVFEICQTPIPFDDIIAYRTVDREYIFRPSYVQRLGKRGRPWYEFSAMVPYAAIYDENERKSAVKALKSTSFGEAVGVDLADALFSTIGEKLNIKSLKSKKYVCRNKAGRVFSTYLEDIPATIISIDGKQSDVYKDSELYPLLGEPIAPSIDYVRSLVILTKEELFTFYGNGIQIDAEEEYERLKFEKQRYEEEKEAAEKNAKEQKRLAMKEKFALPHVSIPTININIPQISKKKAVASIPAEAEIIDAEYVDITEEQMKKPNIGLDLNGDGVVDEKDLEIFKQMMRK